MHFYTKEPINLKLHQIFSLNRFTSEAGRKELSESYAFLPTRIAKNATGHTTIVSWDYRIVCHPLKDDLPLSRLRTVDDLATRLAHKLAPADYKTSYGARYQVSRSDVYLGLLSVLCISDL